MARGFVETDQDRVVKIIMTNVPTGKGSEGDRPWVCVKVEEDDNNLWWKNTEEIRNRVSRTNMVYYRINNTLIRKN